MNSRMRNLALLAAATLVAAGCSSGGGDYVDRDPPMAMNAPPAVAAIANVTTNQDSVVGPVEFIVNDDTTAANQLTVTATVDGDTPIPADGVMLGGEGATRSITLNPLEAATGTANVTVSVKDAQGLTTSRSFSVMVNARSASLRDAVTSTFGKGDGDEATTLNGFTFAQDADDPQAFAGLIGDE
jgi:hypothetical protein